MTTPVFVHKPENIKKIRDYYQMDEIQIKKKVDILREWLKQQPHLPQDQDDDFLEKMLLRNKFRIEQAKVKLDNYYRVKGEYKQYFQEDNREFVPTKEAILSEQMPILIPNDLSRLYVIQINKTIDPENFNYIHTLKLFFLLMEINQKYDYALGEHIFIDLQNLTMDHLKKITIPDSLNVFKLYQEAYSGRILSINLFNAPNLVSVVLSILKMALSTKLYNRIRIFKNNEELLEVFPKECLPKDYGGDLPFYNESAKKWDQIFLEHQDFFTKTSTTISNEKLRVGPVRYNENFGVDGTFKKLSLD